MSLSVGRRWHGVWIARAAVAAAAVVFGVRGTSATKAEPSQEAIIPADVEAAQKLWADGIVDIAKLHDSGAPESEYRSRARQFVFDLYGYDSGHPVLYAPAEATERQFRPTSAGAISYFVGGDKDFAEDDGFALRRWTSVRFENHGIQVIGGEAMAMGIYNFTNHIGNVTSIEYSFGYFRADDGALKINLHHSSYPYRRHNTTEEVGITEKEVRAAQKNWADHVVEIGQYYQKGWHYHERARMFVDTAYAYDISAVLFKPTEALGPTFRTTRDGAVSYFVGGDSGAFPSDSGFALRPWSAISFESAAVLLDGPRAWAAGTYVFKAADSETYEVQYLFGYIRDAKAALRIDLHHSSVAGTGRAGSAEALPLPSASVTEAEIQVAQRAWGDGVVSIGSYHTVEGDYKARAAQLVDSLYAYATRPVYFKPAEAVEQRFRSTRAGAISYFVGGDWRFREDRGFALRPWRAVRFANAAIALRGSEALAMGNMFCTGPGGVQTKIEYTIGYVKDESNRALLVNLHHASFPSEGARRRRTAFKPITEDEVKTAQRVWRRRLVRIGDQHRNRTLAVEGARSLVDDLYGYDTRPVVFRVTDGTAAQASFRLSREGAISYFVGRSREFPSDVGFALRPWKAVLFENAGGINIIGDHAEAMGSTTLTDAEGKVAKVEYTLGYFRDKTGALRIDMHFMSWPYGTKTDGSGFGIGVDVDWAAAQENAEWVASSVGDAVPSKEETPGYIIALILILLICLGVCFALCISLIARPGSGEFRDLIDNPPFLGYVPTETAQKSTYAPATYAGQTGYDFSHPDFGAQSRYG